MFLVIFVSIGFGVWFFGVVIGIGLFVVVGVQSVFILCQGILCKYIVLVVVICVVIDVIFIFVSVVGLCMFILVLLWLISVVLWIGVVFLVWYVMKLV